MDDDLGGPQNDKAFILNPKSWADFTALNSMPKTDVGISGKLVSTGAEARAATTLKTPSSQIAFFMRDEVTKGRDGDEVLPVTYEDNYVTLFPGESRTLWAKVRTADLNGHTPQLRLEGYNVGKRLATFD